MTPVQQARLSGLNASLTKRGVTLRLAGTDTTFTALVEDLGPTTEEFEAGQEIRMFARVLLSPTADGITSLRYGSKLHDADLNRDFTVLTREPHDILSVFRCKVAYL